ncbi:hypothetical protein B0A52_06310 [Exophiala mesophila]|uniref:Family A G protein-coupled receptor-like protein n=1 Tax=Exophiala mesophila TaxID=212818 RepID=A0A438N390_EXOME|nr:hypothetical protein B0A52_06310 [Exophiala mesophila]
MGNRAVEINGFTNTVTTDNHITSRGSSWLFAVTAFMGFSSLVFMGLSFMKPRTQRLFHYLLAALTLISAIAYFSQGSNLGWTAIEVEWSRSNAKVAGGMRQIFYVRYIDYFITTPLLLATLLLTAGLPTPTIWYTLLISEVFVVTRLVGALVKSTYKWGFFTFGLSSLFFLLYTIIIEGRAYSRPLGADLTRLYGILSIWTACILLVYPIIWGVSEGGNVIPLDSEMIAYGILDILTKPIFGAVLLWGLRNVDLERLGIQVRDAHVGIVNEPVADEEKKREADVDAGGVAAAAAAPQTV